MMTWRKGPGCLYPADSATEDALLSLKIGDEVGGDIKRRRNLRHHNLFWALMTKIAENTDRYANAEEIAAAFKVASGHCHWITTPSGRVGLPKSISFASMDQGEFDAFWQKALRYCCTQVIPGMDEQAVRDEIMAIIATPDTIHASPATNDPPGNDHPGMVEEPQQQFDDGGADVKAPGHTGRMNAKNNSRGAGTTPGNPGAAPGALVVWKAGTAEIHSWWERKICNVPLWIDAAWSQIQNLPKDQFVAEAQRYMPTAQKIKAAGIKDKVVAGNIEAFIASMESCAKDIGIAP